MSTPLRATVPDVGSWSRITVRATVDLPQPDSPTRQRVSPRPTAKDTPSGRLVRPHKRLYDRLPEAIATIDAEVLKIRDRLIAEGVGRPEEME